MLRNVVWRLYMTNSGLYSYHRITYSVHYAVPTCLAMLRTESSYFSRALFLSLMSSFVWYLASHISLCWWDLPLFLWIRTLYSVILIGSMSKSSVLSGQHPSAHGRVLCIPFLGSVKVWGANDMSAGSAICTQRPVNKNCYPGSTCGVNWTVLLKLCWY